MGLTPPLSHTALALTIKPRPGYPLRFIIQVRGLSRANRESGASYSRRRLTVLLRDGAVSTRIRAVLVGLDEKAIAAFLGARRAAFDARITDQRLTDNVNHQRRLIAPHREPHPHDARAAGRSSGAHNAQCRRRRRGREAGARG